MPRCIINAGPNVAQKGCSEFLPKYAKVVHFVNADLIASGLSPLVLTENLVSDCFGIDEWKALAKAARSTRRLRLKFSTRTLRCLPSYRFEDNRSHAFEESTVETY